MAAQTGTNCHHLQQNGADFTRRFPAIAAAARALATLTVVQAEADTMHGLSMRSKPIVDVLEAYEAKRWPLGKEPGDKR
jgi:hypothetical protein